MVTFNINLGRKEAVFFMAFFAVIVGVGVAMAFQSGLDPSVMGHSSEEVWMNSLNKTMEQAMIGGEIGGGGIVDYQSNCTGTFSVPSDGFYLVEAKGDFFTDHNHYNVYLNIDGVDEDHVFLSNDITGGNARGNEEAFFMVYKSFTAGVHSYFLQGTNNVGLSDPVFSRCDLVVIK